jgi:enamine deaminase RidA (YjgF/YER057c/UK114 family)
MMTAKSAQPLARYSAYQRRGDFIFLSGVIAVDPVAGRIIRTFDDLPEGVADGIGRTGEFSVDIKDGPILAQSWYVLDRIRATMEEAGGGMGDVFKLVQYFRDLDHFPRYNAVRRMFFPDVPPISTVVEVSAMMPSADILIEVEATAWLPERL